MITIKSKTKLPSITAREIQNSLHVHRRDTYAVMLPNYTPDWWHECDMFGVTKAGYFHEFEIKLSVRDYKIDAKKRSQDRVKYGPSGRYDDRVVIPGKLKHDRLAVGDVQGPSRFFYVVPRELIKASEVPKWAGLIYVFRNERDDRCCFLNVAKDAPKLHGSKVDKPVLRHAINVCYWRFWGERWELDRITRRLRRLEAAG